MLKRAMNMNVSLRSMYRYMGFDKKIFQEVFVNKQRWFMQSNLDSTCLDIFIIPLKLF